MSGLKQEMDQTLERIECMEYRFAERSGDIEEAVGSCETRVCISHLNIFNNTKNILLLYHKLSSNAVSRGPHRVGNFKLKSKL